MSAKLTPAAATRIRTSSRSGLGTGASVIKRMSCGPFSEVCSKARMVAGMLTAISSLLSACLVDQVDLGDRTKESAAAERSELHRDQVAQVTLKVSLALSP